MSSNEIHDICDLGMSSFFLVLRDQWPILLGKISFQCIQNDLSYEVMFCDEIHSSKEISKVTKAFRQTIFMRSKWIKSDVSLTVIKIFCNGIVYLYLKKMHFSIFIHLIQVLYVDEEIKYFIHFKLLQ